MGVKVFCKNCGKLNDKSSAFCMECGKPMHKGGMQPKQPPKITRCPKCGLALQGDKKNCAACGASITGTGEFVPVQPSADTQEPIIDASLIRQCRACGIVNFGFEFCMSCGTDLTGGTADAAGPDGRSASGRRRICSACLGFHPADSVAEFDGKLYCPECIKSVKL